MSEVGAQARADALAHRHLVRARALRAMAEASEYEPEAQAFAAKAAALAAAHGLDPDLLEFPSEPLRVALVISELRRLKVVLREYEEDPGGWATKTAEWSDALDEYDEVLEVAADLVNVPVERLPHGCRRHFRPPERAEIEKALLWRVTGGTATVVEDLPSPAPVPSGP